MIDENYCLSVDHLGRPVDIYHDPDYILRCIGYFKENLKSYMITYDDLDPLSVSVNTDTHVSSHHSKKTSFFLRHSIRNIVVGYIKEQI